MLLEVNPSFSIRGFVINDTITLLVLFHRPSITTISIVKTVKMLLDKLKRKTHAWHKRLNQATLLI